MQLNRGLCISHQIVKTASRSLLCFAQNHESPLPWVYPSPCFGSLISPSLVSFHGTANKDITKFPVPDDIFKRVKQEEPFQAEKKATENFRASSLLGETRERAQMLRHHTLHKALCPLGRNNDNKTKEGEGYGSYLYAAKQMGAPWLLSFLLLLIFSGWRPTFVPKLWGFSQGEKPDMGGAWVFKFGWSQSEMLGCYSAPLLCRNILEQTRSPQQLLWTVLHLINLDNVHALTDTEQIEEQFLPSKAAKKLPKGLRNPPSSIQSCPELFEHSASI